VIASLPGVGASRGQRLLELGLGAVVPPFFLRKETGTLQDRNGLLAIDAREFHGVVLDSNGHVIGTASSGPDIPLYQLRRGLEGVIRFSPVPTPGFSRIPLRLDQELRSSWFRLVRSRGLLEVKVIFTWNSCSNRFRSSCHYRYECAQRVGLAIELSNYSVTTVFSRIEFLRGGRVQVPFILLFPLGLLGLPCKPLSFHSLEPFDSFESFNSYCLTP
jgi:hypothetical protein